MNEDHIAPMTPLDQMLAQDSLQMLKAAVPYFPADVQRVFALYAKMMELSHTIAMFSGGIHAANLGAEGYPACGGVPYHEP